MPASLGGVLSYLRRLAPDGPAAEDGQLLSRFVQGDGGAFTALVGRYAPLVWGVCRRLLGPSHDAEDAFQATFVVLVRKASSLADGRPLGPWLYRVASRTATKARARSARRRDREVNSDVEAATLDVPDLHRRELAAVLDEELGRLPERYRQPMVLCYLEGMTNEEAAQRLACPKGTILSRLSRAREQLRERLARRGVDLSAALLPNALMPAAPPGLVAAVAEAGPMLRSGGAAGFSNTAMILAKGVMLNMFLRKVEMVGLVVLALALAASGAGWFTQRPVMSAAQAAPADPPKAGEKPAAKAEVKEAEKITGLDELGAALAKPVEFPGIDDPQMKLGDVLTILSKLYGVQLDLNERAFVADGIENVADTPIGGKPLLPMKAPLRAVLSKVLSRLPIQTTATFLVRKNLIEITTENEAIRELGLVESAMANLAGLGGPIPGGFGGVAGVAGGGLGGGGGIGVNVRLLPMICQHFRKVPLEKALDDLADASGYNVLIDSRVEEKTAAKVSARLTNVPVDTAVRVLADMAGLSVVRVDNVFYVTSAENAAKIAGEKPLVRPGERRPPAPAKPPGGM